MKKTIAILVCLGAIGAAALLILPRRGESQPAGGGATTITVGIYAPTVPFAGSQARADYVQRLAAAIKQATGANVEAKVFTSYGQAKGADFAIVEAQCVATGGGTVLANAQIGGSTSRSWALYSSSGGDLNALKGKRIAFVKTGCNDNGFIDNAMLESEADGWFSGRVGAGDIGGAVAAVASSKSADAVFAPTGQQRGLSKVLDADSVPNPAFVQFNSKLDKVLAGKVAKAVNGFSLAGAIDGWSGANPGDYKKLRGQMGSRSKTGVAAAPDIVRNDAKEVLKEPGSLDEVELAPVEQHIEAPPGRLE
jgi:hypothetical protein